MKIEVLIQPENDFIRTIYGKPNPILQEVIKANGFEIKYDGSMKEQSLHGFSFSELIELTLSITGNIALSVLANYIYDKCKDKVQKLWINDKETEINKAAIEESLKNRQN